jgi:CMP-N-acetylneuraminic acid synthetase
MKTYAFIFARGGSKGVPGKNIKEFAGKPLLSYSIELAKKIDEIDEIFVSTDDQIIAGVAAKYGASVILRPEELACDNAPEWLAWQHAVKWLEERGHDFDIFLSLPTTSPLRNMEDIHSVLRCLDENTDVVLTMTEAARNPWFNMVNKSKEGFIELLNQDDKAFHRRQDTPVVYNLTTVAYVTSPAFIESANGIFEGRVKAVEIPDCRALDIDTELDFEIAEFLMKKTICLNKEKNYAE